ncbi:regulator of G-protein signaling 21 [Rhynochetos jubatus]
MPSDYSIHIERTFSFKSPCLSQPVPDTQAEDEKYISSEEIIGHQLTKILRLLPAVFTGYKNHRVTRKISSSKILAKDIYYIERDRPFQVTGETIFHTLSMPFPCLASFCLSDCAAVLCQPAHKAWLPNQLEHPQSTQALCCFHRSNAGETMAWSESVDTVLASKDGLAAFRTFLKSEFSEENVEFWLACEDFKKTKSSSKIASKAQKIYSDFIQADAPKEINIDFHTKDHISQNISEPTLSCFDDAQRLIYSLMAKDSFPRFLRSEEYKELVKKQQNGNQKRWLPFL